MTNERTLNNYDDKAARERIKADLGTSLLVEAGAGSGKTTSLVDRMLNLIATGSARMGDIAAITFTNKAASELSGRFRMKLESEWRAAPEGAIKDRYNKALQEIGRTFIGTIHAFCGQLLRERPIEAGVDPAFREMDEQETDEFRNRCWDEYLERLAATAGDPADGAAAEVASRPSVTIEQLAELGIHVEDLRKMFERLSKYEDVSVYTRPMARPDLDVIRLSLFPLIEEAFPYMPTSAPAAGWDPLQTSIRQARRMMRSLDMSIDRNVIAAAKLFDKTIQITQNRWTDKAMSKQFKERFEEWQERVLAPALQVWREFLHPQIIGFIGPACVYARKKRTEAGMLDFQDLLMKTAGLLRTHRGVRHYFAKRYGRLFVDEFQDTDPIQAEMMMLLTGSDPEENDWRKQLPRPGSLFVVGDPKQSIYRFRRADISTYNFVKERIRECGDVLELNKNFRSVHAIGDFVNEAFETKFVAKQAESGEEAADRHSSAMQAEFVRMATQRDNPEDPTGVASGSETGVTQPGESRRQPRPLYGVYKLTCDKVGHDSKAKIAEMDSHHIAGWIGWACSGGLTIRERADNGTYENRPAHPGDFMILLKHKEFIGLYAEKLEQVGISSDTSGSRTVYEEIRALHTLVKCLNDPSDRIPLLAVLRGMLFGISDDSLFRYKREAGHFSWFHLPEEESLSEKAQPVRHALDKLARYAAWVRQGSAMAALTQIVQETGLVPYSAVRPTGVIRAGTLTRLLQLVQADGEACASWSGLAAYLERIMGTEALEGTSLFAGTGQAVRIMNLHKAKGLEAPVVFMAGPCGESDHDATEHIDRLSDPAQGYFTISRPRDAFNAELVAQPAGWPELSERERGFMQAEADRLLYVAATRAMQLLVVSCYPSKPAKDPWSGLAGALAARPELEAVATEPIVREPLAAAPDVAGDARRVTQWLEQGSIPTFDRTSVTERAKSSVSAVELHRSRNGGGMAFGNVVHRCLEALGTGAIAEDEVELFIRLAAAEEGLDEHWLPNALSTVNAVLVHEIWQRAARAKRRYHEFSFTVAMNDEWPAAVRSASLEAAAAAVLDKPAATLPISATNVIPFPATAGISAGADHSAPPAATHTSIVKGVIDFVFEEDDGWVIVDFKTDTFDPEYEAEFVAYYKPQVLAYVEQWRKFGYRVKEAGLWFTTRGSYAAIDLP